MNWTNATATLNELEPWGENPKSISKKAAKRLLDYWAEIGQFQTVAVGPSNGNSKYPVYDGHQRLHVLKAAHGGKFPIDVRVSSRALTDDERAKMVVEAHAGTTGQWDWDALASWDSESLQAWGMDGDLLGQWNTDAGALKTMLDSNEENAGADTEPQIDKSEELRKLWGVELGQMWQLGEHRLICGDCTDEAVIERVMGGGKAEMVFTDPPYNVSYSGGTGRYAEGKIKTNTQRPIDNDNLNLYRDTFRIIRDKLSVGVAYVWFAAKMTKEVVKYIPDDFELRQVIEWYKIKQGFGDMGSNYHCVSEPCLYLVKGNANFIGPNNETNVWELQRPQSNDYHPTEKPLELTERAIKNHKSANVVDIFSGSGTTLIACENLNRRCRAVEIDPGYVAVTLQRYADHTGITPVLVE